MSKRDGTGPLRTDDRFAEPEVTALDEHWQRRTLAMGRPCNKAGDIGAPSVGNADFVVIPSLQVIRGTRVQPPQVRRPMPQGQSNTPRLPARLSNRPDFQFMYGAFQARATRPTSPYGHNEALAIVAGCFT